MQITVFGATGGTGRHIVDQALSGGHRVTAVVRDPKRLPVSHPQLEVITADVNSADAVLPAIRDRDAVLSALAASTKAGGIATTAARAVLGAMNACGTRRFIAISAVPVGPVPEGEPFLGRAVLTPIIRRIFRDVYSDLELMEAQIQRSSTDWTIVRPPRLLDKPATGSYRMRIGSSVPGGHSISRADLANAMLAVIDNPDTVRQIVGVSD